MFYYFFSIFLHQLGVLQCYQASLYAQTKLIKSRIHVKHFIQKKKEMRIQQMLY